MKAPHGGGEGQEAQLRLRQLPQALRRGGRIGECVVQYYFLFYKWILLFWCRVQL